MDMQKSLPPCLGSGSAAAMAFRAACSGISNTRIHTVELTALQDDDDEDFELDVGFPEDRYARWCEQKRHDI